MQLMWQRDILCTVPCFLLHIPVETRMYIISFGLYAKHIRNVGLDLDEDGMKIC